jgi:hypothetical protein
VTKKKLWTIGEIDATGVRGPHEFELQNISKNKSLVFKDIPLNELKRIVEENLGAKIDNIGLNEDWTISLEMFPEVNIHLTYTYYGDEFGDDLEAEFKFFFSGDHSWWIPGEDTATYIDIIMDLLERKIKKIEPFEKNYATKTDLMKKVLLQRSKPFSLLKKEDDKSLTDFLNAIVKINTDRIKIEKEILPHIIITVTWTQEKGLDILFAGEKLPENLSNYHVELLGIFLINHVLRFITIKNEGRKLPDICYIMFSRYYTKEKGWSHRRV